MTAVERKIREIKKEGEKEKEKQKLRRHKINITKTAAKTSKKSTGLDENDRWILRLYVAGKTPKCITAFNNLKRICEVELKGKYSIEVIDLFENPHLSKDDQILAIPTLVRKLPVPVRKIIGDLSNTERVLVGLDIKR